MINSGKVLQFKKPALLASHCRTNIVRSSSYNKCDKNFDMKKTWYLQCITEITSTLICRKIANEMRDSQWSWWDTLRYLTVKYLLTWPTCWVEFLYPYSYDDISVFIDIILCYKKQDRFDWKGHFISALLRTDDISTYSSKFMSITRWPLKIDAIFKEKYHVYIHGTFSIQ